MQSQTKISVIFSLLALLATPAAAQSTEPAIRAVLEPTVEAVRAQYPALVMPDQVGEILNKIAWQHRPNAKLLKKGGGGKCPSPQGVDISCDIVIWAPPGTPADRTLHIDVLSGSSVDGPPVPVPASPFWKSAGACTKRPKTATQPGSNCEMRNALEPIAPAGAPDPPDPPVEPPPTPVTDIERRLKALEDRVHRHIAP